MGKCLWARYTGRNINDKAGYSPFGNNILVEEPTMDAHLRTTQTNMLYLRHFCLLVCQITTNISSPKKLSTLNPYYQQIYTYYSRQRFSVLKKKCWLHRSLTSIHHTTLCLLSRQSKGICWIMSIFLGTFPKNSGHQFHIYPRQIPSYSYFCAHDTLLLEKGTPVPVSFHHL